MTLWHYDIMTHLPAVFGRQRPDWLPLDPPGLQGPPCVLLAVQLPGLEVEHVVPDDAGVLRVEPGGQTGPHGQVVGREHGHHLLHGAAVLLDPVKGLQPVSRHVRHVPPAGCEVVPPQPSDDDDQQGPSLPLLVSFVVFVRSSVLSVVNTLLLRAFTSVIRVVVTPRELIIIIIIIILVIVIIIIFR